MAKTVILGGGMTGLAAGMASGLPVYEAASHPGGICASYYMRPHTSETLHEEPADGEAYHFEVGGGHWIFGGDPAVIEFIRSRVKLQTYSRRSSVYLPADRLYVPYPLQDHLRVLGPERAAAALREMSRQPGPFTTMKEWMQRYFGALLCELFFDPFHELYTAGLYDRIAPQDAYKSPIDIGRAIEGAFADISPVGYNAQFVYPDDGLDVLATRMAEDCDIRYGKRVARIEPHSRIVSFADGSDIPYEQLICTLPLNQVMEMCALTVDCPADPYSSVLVVNVGGTRGPRCPNDHWVYFPASASGFHRVGFYNAVDPRFLPASSRAAENRVSLYVERALPGGARPTIAETRAYTAAVVRELGELGYIGEAEIVDPTWIDVAYTWSWPGSRWRELALRKLDEHRIFQVGRYGRWLFQGIADSIRDGFILGCSFKGD
jgi:protoporphyrinogen oxidase